MAKTHVLKIYKNSYPDSHHSQVGIKFATQNSPLLNLNGIIILRAVIQILTVLEISFIQIRPVFQFPF